MAGGRVLSNRRGGEDIPNLTFIYCLVNGGGW